MQVTDIVVHPPKEGEVRIKILYAALCHTDEFSRSGADPEAKFPCVLGHEATAVVESVGKGVSTCAVGDFVIPCFMPECFAEDVQARTCGMCEGYEKLKTHLCGKIRQFTAQGVMAADGKPRFSLKADGSPVYHFMGTSAFSEYTVCHQESVAVIPRDAPPEKVCLLGCGVATGLGAVWNTANVEEGSTVAVFGLGCVGLACVQAAQRRGAREVLAIDKNEKKFDLARHLGATKCINPAEYGDRPIQDVIVELTNGGVDYAFECVGNQHLIRASLECTHKGWGVGTVVGVCAKEVSTRPFNLILGRTWKGSAFGGWRPRTQVPQLVQKYLDGEIKLDEFISHRMTLSEVNEAIRLLHLGDGIRTVLKVTAD
ncbi:putative alcohol dehydrogenase class III [Neospora caninum Liverpool]|uniref:Putative alcohol dehydrogenase class III n=1 Tax=Neospora caninum (strain Liverpool) TaxID=572307 RepID=F0VN35_NEOCL|nr:putative alcohol dehydrogenase class III [Neospora caninum Liverpool]CBZ55131.1 putative alcohol dehydrogenase class III [Neospora caninum Liverpool]|eukprot:XP_003885159.1 putative alcohol dehydrogenase class III [Neospora caninum Liverpool]